jgi:hypothetical protein
MIFFFAADQNQNYTVDAAKALLALHRTAPLLKSIRDR